MKVLPVFNLEIANSHTFLVGPHTVLAHNGFGSYTCTFASGKKYHGKGDAKRAERSAAEHARDYNDPVKKVQWKGEKNNHDSFVAEAKRIKADGGVKNPQNYNMINSPGKKHLP